MTVRLKQLATLVAAQGSGGIRPFISLENIDGGSGHLAMPIEDIPVRTTADASSCLVEAGDVLFGKLRPYLAKTWRSDRPIYASTELLALHPIGGTDSRWLYYLVSSSPVVEWAIATSEGTKMPRTSWEKLRLFTLANVPEPRIQRAIADYLDTETARIDALITKKQRMVGLLEERTWLFLANLIRQSNAVATQFRRALTSITDGPFGSAFSSSDYTDEGVAVVRLGDIGFAAWRGSDLAHIPMNRYKEFYRHRVSEGDLLIAGLGDERNHAGRACVAPNLGPTIVKGKCFCARVNKARATPEYLAMYCSSPEGANAMTIETRGSTRAMINLDIVKASLIPLPPVAEQAEIVRIVTDQWRRSKSLERVLSKQIGLLAERRQTLITAAATGQLNLPGVAA